MQNSPKNLPGPIQLGLYTIVKLEGDTGLLYDSWDKEVPTDWSGIIKSMDAPEEKGAYIIKIIKKDKISAKGMFYVY
ncbi:hypothetical protein [Sporosarcina sp. FA9]|uniref:hypothetical protein n=1 Tax=Sporosarcina sp. FA9 TaxID=3413030 RepID=UPI003F6598B0